MLLSLFDVMGMRLTLCLALIGLLVTWFKGRRKSRGLPPSPGLALPVIGHLYMLEANPRKQFIKWGEQCGPVFSLYFGSQLIVVLHGFDVIKEAFVKHADFFSERPATFVTQTLGKDRGFLTSGNQWKIQRKLTFEILRDLGLGTCVMEGKVQNEVTRLLDVIEKHQGEPFNPRVHIMQSISNVVSALIFGRGFSHDDPMIADCARLIGEQISLVEGTVALNFFPMLRHLPGDLFGLQRAVNIRDHLEKELIRKQLAMTKAAMRDKSSEDSGQTEDFITGYLRAIEAEKKKGVHDSEINEENLVSVIGNLFAAGTETSSTTLGWALLYLLHHPDVTKKCFAEIESVVGLNRRPAFSDRAKLVYLEATMMEVQRIANITPFALHHTVSADIEFRNLQLPKGTIIMPCLDSVLHSKEIWGDPDTFRPERFIDEDGERLVRPEEMIPYSIGRRSCLGEALAKMEFFLFLSTLIQKYHFRVKKDRPLPPLKDRFGLSCSPVDYEICLVPR